MCTMSPFHVRFVILSCAICHHFMCTTSSLCAYCFVLTAADPPYLIDVFEDSLYVTMYRSFKIIKINKFQKADEMLSQQVLYRPHNLLGAMLVVQENKQKDSELPLHVCISPMLPLHVCISPMLPIHVCISLI
jgi:hypothetical protein